VSVPAAQSRPELKATVQPFKSFESIEELHTCLAHRIAGPPELFRMLNRELDSVNRDAGLICHFKFNRGGSRLDVGFDCLNDLAHDF
jgi:hypothetical protein